MPLPSFAAAVTDAWPGAAGVTLPDWSTVATDGLEVAQVSERSVAVAGWTLAASVNGCLTLILSGRPERVMLVTGLTLSSTVTAQVAWWPPSDVLTVMTAAPSLPPAVIAAVSGGGKLF